MPNTEKLLWNRIGLIVSIVEKKHPKIFGRTAIMKLLYLLQTIKNVPLKYDFSLYIYGPFDQDVLDDLDYAETLGAVTSEVIYYSSGYGYQIGPGEKTDKIKEQTKVFLEKHQGSIDDIFDEFGEDSASDLELISTVIYTDRLLAQRKNKAGMDKLVEMVTKIKPRFKKEYVRGKSRDLKERGFLVLN